MSRPTRRREPGLVVTIATPLRTLSSRNEKFFTDISVHRGHHATLPLSRADAPVSHQRARTELVQDALRALRLPSEADPPSVQDHAEAERPAFGSRDHRVERRLDLHRIGLLGERE